VRTLFTTDALLPGGWAHNVRIDIDGHGNIAEVEPNASPAGCEMTGGPVIPGMPNLHSHAFQRAMDDPGFLKSLERAGMERYYMVGEDYMKWVRRTAEEEKRAVERLGLNK